MSRPFIAIVPQTITDGDKILLKGQVKTDANEFSINFANGTDPNPENIVYHFKTILHDNQIVENWKKDGGWNEEQTTNWERPDGRGFALEFVFNDGIIYTYWVENENGRNNISEYEHESDLNEINSIQVWGDVEKIEELTFRYS